MTNRISMADIETRLRELRLSVAEFARRIGETPQTVHNWKSRGVPIPKEARVAEVLQCSLERLRPEADKKDLRTDLGALRPILAWENAGDLPPDRYVLIPRLSVRFGAGPGKFAWKVNTEQPLAFLSDWLRGQRMNPQQLVTFMAEGESMQPIIRDGSVLLVDLSQTHVVDGRIYALRYGDELRVKRLFKRLDGTLIIRSDFAECYPEEVVSGSDLEQLQIIGRVVWVGGVV